MRRPVKLYLFISNRALYDNSAEKFTKSWRMRREIDGG